MIALALVHVIEPRSPSGSLSPPMARSTLRPLLLVLLLSLPSAPATAAGLQIPLERYTLPSGLVVVLHPDHRVPTVAVSLWFRVGSGDERPGLTGFAHLFEHLMFMGTRRVPSGELDRIVEAEGGVSNASTSEDETGYLDVGPAHLLETFLWLEADRLATLGDDITEDKLERQRAVVENERRQSYENRPYGAVELVLPEHLFPIGHPYHHPVIGAAADLRAATVADVRGFFATWYRPDNAQLVVAGDFEASAARRMIDRWFGWMPQRPPSARPRPAPATLLRSERVVLPDRVEVPQVTLAFLTAAAFAPGDAECDLLATALAGGRASRLTRALVRERGILQSVTAEQRAGAAGGYLLVTALGQPGHPADEIERALDEELARLGREPPDAAELGRARALLQLEELAHLERLPQLVEELQSYQRHLGDAGQLGRRALGRYDAVTPARLAEVARQLIAGRPRVAIVVVPADGPAATAEEARR